MNENLTDVVANALEVARGFVGLGRREESRVVCEKILKLQPDNLDALFILGCIAHGEGSLADARRHLKKAELVDGNHVATQALLGLVTHCLGNLDEAVSHYAKVLEGDPEHLDALVNLGVIYQGAGERAEALDLYTRAVAIDANSVPALLNLGALHVSLQQFEVAEGFLRRALISDSNSIPVLNALAICLKNQGRRAECLTLAKRVLEQDPHQAHALMSHWLSLPVLPGDEAAIASVREDFCVGIEKMSAALRLSEPERIREAVDAIGSATNFSMHYHGQNDRALQLAYGSLCESVMGAAFPHLMQNIEERKHKDSGRIRVGFISSYWRHHSIFKTHGAFVHQLDSNAFEVHAIHLGDDCDVATQKIREAAAVFHHWPDFGPTHAERILRLKLDVLVYPDYGMEPRLQWCAPLRLAPVQCNMGGHPVTSGLQNMDYFLSSELMEPDNGEDHYTEKLIRLPGLMSAYPKPPVSSAEQPTFDSPIPQERVRYVCLQSLYKLLPQFDWLYAAIAKQVPTAHFSFIQESSSAVTASFCERLEKSFASEGLSSSDYVHIRPRMSQSEFYGFAQAAHVVLDSVCWSGNNSSMEALAFGRPIVTLPGALMRGRHTYAILQSLGITDTVAQDLEHYVSLAVRLGRESPWRQELGERLLASQAGLYDNLESVRGFEEFLRQVVPEM